MSRPADEEGPQDRSGGATRRREGAPPRWEVDLTAYLRTHAASCPGCGYDLWGLRNSRCPECGLALSVGLLHRPEDKPEPRPEEPPPQPPVRPPLWLTLLITAAALAILGLVVHASWVQIMDGWD